MSDHRQGPTCEITRDNAKTWPRPFVSRFLEAGIISYEDMNIGKELLAKETIDAFVKTFEGKPLIIRHSKTTPQNMEGKAVGYISRVWFDPADAWFYAEGVVKDDDAKQKIEQGWSVSCSYEVKSTGNGGKYHAIDYAREITAFEGEHLAIVENPRYEGANIRLNEKPKENTKMSLLKIIKKALGGDRENSTPVEVPADSATVTVGQKAYRLNDLVEAYKAAQKERANSVSLNDTVEIDGHMIAIKDLLPKEETDRDNEAKQTHDNKTVEDLGGRKGLKAKKHDNEDDEDEDSDEDESRRNKDAKDRDNGLDAFQTLGNAAAHAYVTEEGSVAISVDTAQERINRGIERYGAKKAAK